MCRPVMVDSLGKSSTVSVFVSWVPRTTSVLVMFEEEEDELRHQGFGASVL